MEDNPPRRHRGDCETRHVAGGGSRKREAKAQRLTVERIRRVDVLPDGSHFLGVTRGIDARTGDLVDDGLQDQIHIVENWKEELKRVVPAN